MNTLYALFTWLSLTFGFTTGPVDGQGTHRTYSDAPDTSSSQEHHREVIENADLQRIYNGI